MENIEYKVYYKNIDFYWKSIAIYSVLLIIFSLLIGVMSKGELTVDARNPLVLLLAGIIAFTCILYVYNRILEKKIVIYPNQTLIFKTRFSEKKYDIDDLKKIQFIQGQPFSKQKIHYIRLRIKDSFKTYLINPWTFSESKDLIHRMNEFRNLLRKQK